MVAEPLELRQTRIVQIEEPEESLLKLLRKEVENGATPDEAADAVMAPYQDLHVVPFARPAIVRAAEIEYRNRTRRAERAAFAPTTSASEHRDAIRASLAVFKFKVNGVAVSWEAATVAQHRARAAWLDTQIEGIEKTRRQHLCAAELIEEHGVTSLGEIPDWQNLMSQRLGADQS